MGNLVKALLIGGSVAGWLFAYSAQGYDPDFLGFTSLLLTSGVLFVKSQGGR